jgi:hypothetical protein
MSCVVRGGGRDCPSAWWVAWRVACLAVCVVVGAGCGKVRERQAIRKYAESSARANGKLATLRALEANILVVQRSGRVQRVRRFFKDKYLPAFRAYRGAVRRVVTGTARLRVIHGRLVRAVDQCYEAYASYADHVTGATLTSAWVPVQRSRQQLAAAEERYRRDMATYYRKNDVKLAGE